MEKIKAFVQSEKGKDIIVVLIVIVVGFGAFELGRLSVQNPPIKPEISTPSPDRGFSNPNLEPIEPQDGTDTGIDSPKVNLASSAGKAFFASTRGSKYYPVNCSAGKTIKESNKIYFTDSASAEKAGYTLSSSCS